MKIEDVDGETEESSTKGANSVVNEPKEPKDAQSKPNSKDKKARRMKIEEVDSDDGECEEIVVNGSALKQEIESVPGNNSPKEKVETDNSSKDIWNDKDVEGHTVDNSSNVNTRQCSKSGSTGVTARNSGDTEETVSTDITTPGSTENVTENNSGSAVCSSDRASPVAVNDTGDSASEQSELENSKNSATDSVESLEIKRPVFYTKELPAQCSALKEEATALFKSGQYGDASHKYSKVIDLLVKGMST